MKAFSGYDAENRFVPYIEMHEFEALLFSDVYVLARKIEVDVLQVLEILEKYDNPEEFMMIPRKRRQNALKQ